MLSLPLRTPGISLIAFYLMGSRATKAGKARKATLEDGHDTAGAGYRTAAQVFSNSASALVATLLWGALHAPGFPGARRASLVLEVQGTPYAQDEWCPLDPAVSNGWSRALLLVVLGHFACCLGDTLASELDILSETPPILLTTLKTVPPGTNGGLSLVGTAASVGGGMAMGWVMWATLSVENAVCRDMTGEILLQMLALGALAGGAGSLSFVTVLSGLSASYVFKGHPFWDVQLLCVQYRMLDSLLGATLQRTQYSETRKLILIDTAAPPEATEEIKIVSGIDVFTNNQASLFDGVVNLIASTATALALAYFF
ncbi:integral membrane protein DUF92-domain-containing protein [Amylostereum chailletii]|nr:integral membrane protein DUF92-domain-containing protein [Amylostereum chailletii]